MSYWKEYVSGLYSGKDPVNPDPVNNVDLSNITIDTIRMNCQTVDNIRLKIIVEVAQKLSKYHIYNNVDYEIKPFDKDTLVKLLDFKTAGTTEIARLTLNITALPTSTIAIGSATALFENSPQFDPDHVIDLSTITMSNVEYNFNGFKVEKLRQWILTDISNKLINNGTSSLKYQTDYVVNNLDDKSLQTFLNNNKKVTRLMFTISVNDDSVKAANQTTILYINNPNSQPAPPDPVPPSFKMSWFKWH